MVNEDMSFKNISIFSSRGHFVQMEGRVCAIFIEGIMRNISANLF